MASSSRITSIVNKLLDYVTNCVRGAGDLERIYNVIPPDIDELSGSFGIVLWNQDSLSFNNQTPIVDEIEVPFAIAIRKTNIRDVSIAEQCMIVIEKFTDKFYSVRHPNDVGYQGQIVTFGGTDSKPEDEYIEIEGLVTMKCKIIRSYSDNSEEANVYGGNLTVLIPRK
mgnify:CR=1 FL=1